MVKQVEVLGRNGFRLLAGSTLVSRFGDIIAGLGFLYVAYRTTGSQSATTVVAVAEVVPYLLFGLLGGVLSDSLPKLRVMKAANWYRAGLEVVTVGLLLTGTMTYAAIVLLPLLIQIGGVIYNPCSRASVVHVVDPEDRVGANSVMSLIENITAIVAPLAASAILFFGDALWVFFAIDALTFVVGALLLGALGRQSRGAELLVAEAVPEDAPHVVARTWSRFRLFWSGVRTSPVLVLVFVSTFLTVLSGTWAWQMGLLFISLPDPHGSTWFYSSMLALYAVAGIVMGLVLPVLTSSLTILHYRCAVLVWAGGLLLIGLGPNRVVVTIGVTALGAGISLASQTRAFLLQEHVPRWAIGQGFAVSAVLLYSADALSLIAFGALNEALGTAHTVALAGGLMLVSLVVAIGAGRAVNTALAASQGASSTAG
jgi:DHA3 family macrolide efflux protein-like MFS transporter